MADKSQDQGAKLFKGLVIYSIGNLGTKLLSFLIVPMYTYYIEPTEMGIYDLIISTINLLMPLQTLQIADAAYRWLVRGGGHVYQKTAVQIVLLNSLCFFAASFIVEQIVDIQFYWYACVVMLSGALLELLQKILRGIGNQRLFALSGVLYTFVFLVLNVYQIAILHNGITSLFISTTVSNILVILIILLVDKRTRINPFGTIDKTVARKMLKLSVPLIPNQLNWWVMSSSDRYIISCFLGAAANGVYSIAYKFPSLLQLVISLFTSSWQDVSVAEVSGDNDNANIFRNLYKFSFSLLFWLLPLTALYIRFAMKESYQSAAEYTSFLYLGAVFQGFSSFYGVGYLKNKDTQKAALTSIYGSIVNIAVHLLLVLHIGLYAAAISTFAGYLVMWYIRERQNREVLNIKINWTEFLIFFVCAIFCTVMLPGTNVVTNIIWTVVGLLLFLIINKSIIVLVLKKVLPL